MEFDIITIFPEFFEAYFSKSILGRAQQNKKISVRVHNLRDYTSDKHRTVDDTPYGGGAGMVMKVEPIFECTRALRTKAKKVIRSRTILFSAKGKKYTQKDARRLAKYDRLILICGRYEGVDERVAKHIADEEISIGDYVLTGGELPAMILADSVSRLLPGVLGNPESLVEESFNSDDIQNSKFKTQNSTLEYPQYTKPEIFNAWKVPEVLLGGNHQEIAKWRKARTKSKKK